MEENFIELKLRLDWSEMDLFGHINNVSFFKYLQAARVNCWDVIGLNKLHGKMNTGPILAKTECSFRKPLHFPGNIAIRTSVETIGASSFTLVHHIYNDASELCAEGRDVIVTYDFNENQKLELPDAIRTELESWLIRM